MPKYEFDCPDCAEAFDLRRSVEERHTAPCPSCGGRAPRRFRPDAVFVQTPETLRSIPADFQPRATAQHTANYLQGALVDRTLAGLHAADETGPRRKSVKEILLKKYPDTRLDRQITGAETAEIGRLLAQGPPHVR